MQKRENGTLKWARWFLERGFAVFPVDPETKKAVVKEWQKYSTTPLSDEEKRQYLDMIAKGYNYAVPGGQRGLVILDFEDKELLKNWAGGAVLNVVCRNTLCVDTPHGGLHVYGVANEVPPQRFNPLFIKENKRVADLQSFNSYVVGPGSCINHKHCDNECPWKGQDYATCYIPHEFNKIGRFDTLKGILNVLAEEGKKLGIELSRSARVWIYGEKEETTKDSNNEEQTHERKKKLSNDQILEITKVLEPVYKAGARHGITLYLVGWLYKAGVSYESAKKLVETICEHFKDEQCEDRINTLNDTYGIGKPTREERIKQQGKKLKTKGGLYEWVVEENKLVNEQQGLGIIKKIEEVLEAAEPNPSVIIELLNYEKQIFAIVNFNKCEVLTAMRNDEKGLLYKDRVFIGCPESVTAVMTPFSQIIRYDLVWNIPLQKRKKGTLTLESVTVDEILAYLKANGLVLKKYQAEDVLNAILNAMLRKGLADIKTGFDAPGFYWMDGKIIANKVEVSQPDPQELKEALELLNELVNVWFFNVKEQFVTALKLGLLMPFSFAIKQKFKGEKGFLPWLYLYGQRDTGKTTTAEILLYIYNIMNRQHELGVGEVNTEAKLGAVLSSDTFPHLINEGASLFDKPHLSEIIKQAVEGLIARQRFENKTIIKEYPAFAPLMITANELRITDEALTQKRLVVIRYPISAKVSKEKILEFREKVSQRLPKLRALGQFVTWYLVKHPEELTYDWINLSRKLLEKAYEDTGLAPGFDINMQFIDFSEDDPRFDIIAVLWKRILDAYNKKVEVTNEGGDYVVVSNPLGILESVLESRAVDFMIKKNDEILFTSKVIQLLRDEGVNIDSMNGLAELFADYKFEYAQRRVMGKKMKVLTVKNEDLVNLFYDFFKPEEEDKDVDNAQKDA